MFHAHATTPTPAITAAIAALPPTGDKPIAVTVSTVKSETIGPHSNQCFLEPHAPAFTTRREIPVIFNRASTGMRKPPRKKTTVANIKRGTAEATAQTSRARGSLDCSADQLDSDVTTSTRASTVIKPNGHEANAHQARFVLGLKS